MSRVQSFPPIARQDARILILGSMPGTASLAAGQYYAHERNAFWPIMGDLLGFNAATMAYPDRVSALQAAHIAVWDVLQSCTRPGSLDSKIEKDSLIMNDFPGFLDKHPHIAAVFFNGSAAEACFRQVLPGIGDRGLQYTRLPSTSPAHAALSLVQKREAWRAILKALS